MVERINTAPSHDGARREQDKKYFQSLEYVLGQKLPNALDSEQAVPEIESKFLITSLPSEVLEYIGSKECSREVITQGYLRFFGEGGTSKKIRLRVKQSPGQPPEFWLAHKKRNAEGIRMEAEILAHPASFALLWKRMTDASIQPIRKIRFHVPHKDAAGVGPTIELDVFTGDRAGLVLAEVEFKGDIATATAAEAAFLLEKPTWLQRDVSKDKRYGNSAIAEDGIPDNEHAFVGEIPEVQSILESVEDWTKK